MIPPGATEVRSSTAIERKRRIVIPGHLFSTETIPPDVPFEAKIGGTLDDGDMELLSHCAKILTHFGAGSARGLGECAISLIGTGEAA
jgi:CRISPR/Cas system CSM-associated protein Csm3 (group 7 of RAMP superfamily)